MNTPNKPAKTSTNKPPPRRQPLRKQPPRNQPPRKQPQRKQPQREQTPTSSSTDSEGDESDPVAYWVRETVWPYAYIKPGPNDEKMSRVLAKKKAGSRKRSEPSSMGSDTGDQNISYRSRRFVQVLRIHGCIMEMSKKYHISKESRDLCAALLDHGQELPRESLFDDDIFVTTCRGLPAVKRRQWYETSYH